MATQSAGLAVLAAYTEIANAAMGEEVVVFGLVFQNTTNAVRTVTLRIQVSSMGATVEIPFELKAKGDAAHLDRLSWEKAIGLQPGDTLEVKADAVGVNLVYSLDTDDGSEPILKGLKLRGDYSALAEYAENDVVVFGGVSYGSRVAANTGNQPDISPADWQPISTTPAAQIAAAVDDAFDAILDGAPGALDTLNELAAALGDDPNFAATVNAALTARALKTITITGAGILAGQGGDLSANRVFTITAASLAQMRAGQSGAVVATPEALDDSLEFVAVADASTVAWDLEAAPNGKVTFTAARAIGAPTNAKVGKIYILWIEWGTYAPSFNAAFDFGENGLGTVATGAGKFGLLDAQCLTTAPLKFRSNLWKGA